MFKKLLFMIYLFLLNFNNLNLYASSEESDFSELKRTASGVLLEQDLSDDECSPVTTVFDLEKKDQLSDETVVLNEFVRSFADCMGFFSQELLYHKKNGILLRENVERKNRNYTLGDRDVILDKGSSQIKAFLFFEGEELQKEMEKNVSSFVRVIQAISEDQSVFVEKYSSENSRSKMKDLRVLVPTFKMIERVNIFAREFNHYLSNVYKLLWIRFPVLDVFQEIDNDSVLKELEKTISMLKALSDRYYRIMRPVKISSLNLSEVNKVASDDAPKVKRRTRRKSESDLKEKSSFVSINHRNQLIDEPGGLCGDNSLKIKSPRRPSIKLKGLDKKEKTNFVSKMSPRKISPRKKDGKKNLKAQQKQSMAIVRK